MPASPPVPPALAVLDVLAPPVAPWPPVPLDVVVPVELMLLVPHAATRVAVRRKQADRRRRMARA
jgi:hypothetical protein